MVCLLCDFYCFTPYNFCFPCVFIYYQLVLELQEDGKLVTSDDPPVVFGSLDKEFIQKVLL
jgi:hypothetical protein